MQTLGDDEEDFFAPRTFVTPEESNDQVVSRRAGADRSNRELPGSQGIPSEITSHRLSVDPKFKPVKQKRDCSPRGIEINPNKISAIEEITVVNNMKAVQRLTERIAALGRFISRSSGKSHHFFALLKRKSNFKWTPECQRALEELKRYLSSPPLLHTPKEDETLFGVGQGLGSRGYRRKMRFAPRGKSSEREQQSPGRQDTENNEADALANLGSSAEEEDLRPRFVVQLIKSVVKEGHTEINSSSLTWDLRNKYIIYLKDGKLPTDPKESKALQTKAARFSFNKNGALYRRTFDGPLAVCLGSSDTGYVLREIHEGSCGNHSGADSLVRKAESTNKTIIQNLKKKLESAKGKWRESLPEVLWAYQTTPKSSRGETHFSLVYGAEAPIPVEVGEPSTRFWNANKESNHEAMATALELLDERREASLVRMAAQKQKIERYYNKRTNLRYFGIGDLVLRKVTLNT
uniref:Uncharacterized protein LOC104239185 n=1 Tax=Nicotiana sylvestris TaxID=4096 RepID=A0A1U7XYM3_NICSY|nr:PREDICTED: uncharacterized protein LOC104239185 [Nicotiana sylvestris]